MPIIKLKEATTTARSLAYRNATGVRKYKTYSFPLFTRVAHAEWIANRMIRAQIYPQASIKLVVSREQFRIEAGDLFRLTLPEHGMNDIVFRCVDLDEDTLADAEVITIVGIEELDYVSSTATTIGRSTLDDHAPTDVEALDHVDFKEAPYAVAGAVVNIIPLAAKKAGNELGCKVLISNDGGSSYTKIDTVNTFQLYGTLSGTYGTNTYMVDDTVGFQIDFPDMITEDLDVMETTTRAKLFSTTNISMLGDEILTWQTITPISGTLYEFSGIRRGMFDTKRQAHSTGEDFWFIGGTGYRLVDDENILSGVTIHQKLVPFTTVAAGEESEATAVSGTLTGRAHTPYEPINLVVSGTYNTYINLQWGPRVRGGGLGTYSPENVIEDNTYTHEGYFKVETVVSGSIVRTTTGIDARIWTYTEAMNLSDNGSLPSQVSFNLYNYKTTNSVQYTSTATTLTVDKV